MSVPFKRIMTIDFETAWDSKDYTLSKMTNEEYVRDPRFKAWGMCYHFLGEPDKTYWVGDRHLPDFLGRVDWSTTAVLAQNTMFDASILAWHYGVHPVFMFDTLSMGRALRGPKRKNSLAAMAEDYCLPPKGKAVHSTDGITDRLGIEIERELAEYCKHDVYLCEELFKRFLYRIEPGQVPGTTLPLLPQKEWRYPIKELRLIDMILRMYTRPLLQADTVMLETAIDEEREHREALLTRLGVNDAQLASTPQFAAILEALGVDVPYKKSPKTGEDIPALAKKDAMFQALLTGDDENVSALCEARLLVKSTTERTRAQRFCEISKRGSIPFPVSYYGAGTGRLAAARGEAINMQNLKRGSRLRQGLMAPDGHVVGVVDLSQIEPRVLACMADYEELLNVFRSGQDPYATFGITMFNIPGLTKETHPVHRQSAKSAMLGAGYQLGWASFAAQLLVGFLGAPPVRYEKAFAKQLGIDAAYIQKFLDYPPNVEAMLGIAHTCTKQELLVHCVVAKKLIELYRASAYPVVGLWTLYDQLIERSLADGEEYRHKCLVFRKEEIVLPNGMSLLYPNLRRVKDPKRGMQWVYGEDTKLYAGKITNNTTQALARIIMTDGMLRQAKRLPVIGSVHDESITLLEEAHAQEQFDWAMQQMLVEPKYLPGIPLAADGGWHKRYGLAKQ